MGNPYAILPCNGLDKCAGSVSREVALLLAQEDAGRILCPVFYRVSDTQYNKLAGELPLLVIDGCATRCASKLAGEKNLTIARRIIVTEEAKAAGVELAKGLGLGDRERELARSIADRLGEEAAPAAPESPPGVSFPQALHYEEYRKDKFLFRLPKDQGFYFTENDVWAYVSGGRARIGITDYVQKSLSDILFFSPPALGTEVEQFDTAGDVESAKAVFEVISPVGGVITAVNERLVEEPELMNQNPYDQGWIAELELSYFESDRELLHTFAGYFPILKKKVDEYRV